MGEFGGGRVGKGSQDIRGVGEGVCVHMRLCADRGLAVAAARARLRGSGAFPCEPCPATASSAAGKDLFMFWLGMTLNLLRC
jgi:hypothetical protein